MYELIGVRSGRLFMGELNEVLAEAAAKFGRDKIRQLMVDFLFNDGDCFTINPI